VFDPKFVHWTFSVPSHRFAATRASVEQQGLVLHVWLDGGCFPVHRLSLTLIP